MLLYRAYRTWADALGIVILANTKEEATKRRWTTSTFRRRSVRRP